MTIQRCVSLRVRKSKSEKYESLKYALELLANFGQGGEEDKPDQGRQEQRRDKKRMREDATVDPCVVCPCRCFDELALMIQSSGRTRATVSLLKKTKKDSSSLFFSDIRKEEKDVSSAAKIEKKL